MKFNSYLDRLYGSEGHLPSSFPVGMYFINTFSVIPNYMSLGTVTSGIFNYLKSNFTTNVIWERSSIIEGKPIIKESVISFEKIVMHFYSLDNKDDVYSNNITGTLYFINGEERINEFIKNLQPFFVLKDIKGNSINLIVSNRGNLDCCEFELKIGEIDIALNYGEKFVPLYERKIKRSIRL